MTERERGRFERMKVQVSLDQYATVIAGLEDGLLLDDLLAFIGIPRAAWSLARERWEARVVADLAVGGALAEALEAAKVRALLSWPRPLPPLDDDLRAYLDFERAFAEAEDHDTFLTNLGLSAADPLRLLGIWSPRLTTPDIAAQAVRMLAAPRREVAAIRPGAPRLPPRRG